MASKKIVIDYKQSLRSDDLQQAVVIDYKKLRSINPEAARTAVLDYLKSNGENIADCARIFGVNRVVIYDIINKQSKGNLRDQSKAPKNMPRKTSAEIETVVVEARNRTGFGPKWLLVYLMRYHQIDLAYGTVRNILRRNKHKIIERPRISWEELQ
ncbi:MAG: hypothetical protein Q7R49_03245 [Candidatus Daviesbacteria bacterium]|nr:hypothetical protein [Candidatus Daviesbacteria bacterium]